MLLPVWWVVQTAHLLQWVPALPSPASGCYSVLQFCVTEQAICLTLGSQLGLKSKECTVGALDWETPQDLSLSPSLEFKMALVKSVKLTDPIACHIGETAMTI